MPNERLFYKIGIYLERALQEKDMSITQLSKLTGIKPDLLRRYIMNDKSPSLAAIKKIAEALDKDPDYFLSDTFYKNGEMRAHALRYDLMVNFKKGDEKSVRKSYRAIEKMISQIFNNIYLEGQEELVERLFMCLTDEICPLAEKYKIHEKKYWYETFTDESYLQQSKKIDRRTLYQIINAIVDVRDKQLDDDDLQSVFDEDKVSEMTQEFLNKFDTLEEIQKNDNGMVDEEND